MTVIETDWPSLRKRVVKHVTTLDVLKKERRMKVKMQRDLDAAFDGINVQRLKAGKAYDIPQSFADRYLAKGIASEVKAKPEAPENKAKGPAPENKARKPKKK